MNDLQKRLEALKEELERIENNASGYYDYYDIKTKTFTRLTKEETIERAIKNYEQEEQKSLIYDSNVKKADKYLATLTKVAFLI